MIRVAGPAIVLVASVSGLIIAEATPLPTPQPYAEYSALAALCFTLVWIVTKTAPAFVTAIRELQDSHAKVQAESHKAIETLSRSIGELSSNCAARGEQFRKYEEVSREHPV